MSEVQTREALPAVSRGRYAIHGEGRNYVLSYVEDTCETCQSCGCGTPKFFTTADAIKMMFRSPAGLKDFMSFLRRDGDGA